MYPVELDLILRFLPPMSETGPGIRLTRRFELPFPPTADARIHSKDWDGADKPLGFCLKQLIWDIDRNCFVAETEMSAAGVPIALIPQDIRFLVDRGWRFGSYLDNYRTEIRRGRKRSRLPAIHAIDWDDDEALSWEVIGAKKRPKEFKTILHSVVATMVQLGNNTSVAYAMLQTSGYVDLPDAPFHGELTVSQRRFAAEMKKFDAMSFDERDDWCDYVQGRYPRLVEVVEATC